MHQPGPTALNAEPRAPGGPQARVRHRPVRAVRIDLFCFQPKREHGSDARRLSFECQYMRVGMYRRTFVLLPVCLLCPLCLARLQAHPMKHEHPMMQARTQNVHVLARMHVCMRASAPDERMQRLYRRGAASCGLNPFL